MVLGVNVITKISRKISPGDRLGLTRSITISSCVWKRNISSNASRYAWGIATTVFHSTRSQSFKATGTLIGALKVVSIMLVNVGSKVENLRIMAKPTVYGTPLSTYVRTVRLLLEEAGADYSLKEVNIFNGENESAEYLAKNPFGKVPTLEVDGELLYETTAITNYLDTVLAGHKFSPSNPMLQARMRQIIAIIDSYLYSPAITSIVIQRLIVPSQGGETDADKVKNAVPPAQTAFKAIESLISDSPYLLGSEVSIADFYLIPIFTYLSQTPEFDLITAQTPKLRAWWNEASKLASVRKVCT